MVKESGITAPLIHLASDEVVNFTHRIGKELSSAHFLEGWKGTIPVLDLLENIKSLVSAANRTAYRTAHSLLLTIPTGLSHNLTSSHV